VLAADRLELDDPVIFMHPRDGRPVFVFPWLGRIGVGTTDIDHDGELDDEASISAAEATYLFEAVEHLTGERLTPDDVISSWSGVRPVLSSGAAKRPSQEKRDEAVWANDGLVCASGGKLTTFRLIAQQALAAALPSAAGDDVRDARVFAHRAPVDAGGSLGEARRRALAGRFGAGLEEYELLPGSGAGEIDGTPYALAELRYGARCEMVEHLDDLLLRRTRLGNLLAAGGEAIMDDVKQVCCEELGWDEARWREERERYERIWRAHYAPPVPA
jgi:glycerol-3-phosphate dehydrogenase